MSSIVSSESSSAEPHTQLLAIWASDRLVSRAAAGNVTEDRNIQGTGADPRSLLKGTLRHWRLVIACWVALVGTVVVLTATQEKQYSAVAGLLFRDPGLDQKLFGTTFLAPSRDPAREAATNVKLVSLDVVARRAAERIGGISPERVAAKVEAAAEGQSDVVSVTATDPSPVLARRLANTFAAQYIAFRRQADRAKISEAERLVQSRLAALSPAERAGDEGRSLKIRADQLDVLASLQTGNAELVQPAQTPTAPSSPRVKRNIGLAVVLGLIVGVGFALLLDRLDRRIREPEELEEALGMPILGLVPRSAALAARGAGATPQEISLPRGEAEAFRMLRARMRYFNVDREVRTVLVSSASAADGKTTVALHLAAAAAASGERVLLIEADLRRPTLTTRMGEPQYVGLSEVLTHTASLEQATRHVWVGVGVGDGSRTRPGFDLISAGFPPPNPSELIESHRMQELLAQLAPSYDLVLIDTPPLLVVSDAIPLIKRVDGVVIVSRLSATTRDAARHLRAQLAGLNAPVLGVVANDMRGKAQGYYYGYGYDSVPAVDGSGLAPTKSEPAARTKVGRRRD